MSENKTEQPTQKRLQDAAKKGQGFKSKDVMTAILLACGVLYASCVLSFAPVTGLIRQAVLGPAALAMPEFGRLVVLTALKMIVPILAVCVVASALPSLLISRFQLATEALKLNWEAINPVSGFKRIFSKKTLKELVKALLTLTASLVAGWLFWQNHRREVFSALNGNLFALASVSADLLRALVLTLLACMILILILDLLADFFLFMKDMMMDKQEIKQEYKEQEGNPEVKSRRREIHLELLSEQDKSDIENSKFMLSNPTHIAIGVYFNPDIAMVPFISYLASNQKALAARKYAESIGIPVVRDIPLARKIYRTHSRYSFIDLESIGEIVRILIWLDQVDMANQPQAVPADPDESPPA